MSPPDDNQLPPPLPGSEAADRRAENPIPPAGSAGPTEGRPILRAVLIGLGGFVVSAAIPIVIVIILAILAQSAISGH